MSEQWSPFDPKWYNDAFEKYTYNAEELFNTENIMSQGYIIPDADGSRSSIFHDEAILNNSFNEDKLRETLKDIYLNNSHKLTAINHDNTHFFHWIGTMEDMSITENTRMCEFIIPTETFIFPNTRDKFKLSQFYRKWISVQDILNNWEIFQWCCLLFINQRIYSEYEIRIDDHQTTIRFKYNEFWRKKNYPVYIYKFDTNSSCRIKISKELCENQWNWKLPVSYIDDKRILNNNKIIAYFNRIADTNIRTDGFTNIDALGDNLEFLTIEDGYIDLSHISDFNRRCILSENKEYLWMSIIVPKFFHEYPILLPADSIYRAYEANFQLVSTLKNNVVQHVKSNIKESEVKQVYVDINGDVLKENKTGWKEMIRPMILSDAFNEYKEPYDDIISYVNDLKETTIIGADIIKDFRMFMNFYTTDDDFNIHLDKLTSAMKDIYEKDHILLDILNIEYDKEFESFYNKFLEMMNDIRSDGRYSKWLENFPAYQEKSDFWFMISPLIYLPRDLADKYFIVNIISKVASRSLWEDTEFYKNKVRFQRPIDESDIWTFEYYPDGKVWRPYPLQIEKHFPDVYILKDGDKPISDRLFKSFFFYTDTPNILETYREQVIPTADWNNDVEKFHFDQFGIYKDVFMEKFYWMGIQSIYNGMLSTKSRWEVIEYVIDNPSFDRFNELFLNTIDPYIRLGLATYLRGANYQFPFDDAISKMNKNIDTKWLGYRKVTNFEMYLNKTWIPSYFDYIETIIDSYNYHGRHIKRPRSSFDIDRFLPILTDVQTTVVNEVNKINDILKWILDMLSKEDYHLDVSNVDKLVEYVGKIKSNIDNIAQFTKDLDIDIYSIDDINSIIYGLNNHNLLIEQIDILMGRVYGDAVGKTEYDDKKNSLEYIMSLVAELPVHIQQLLETIQTFDMNQFMDCVNDLKTYFTYDKNNADDKSLIGHINKFEDPWSSNVKEKRNKLFQSTSILFGNFKPEKSYEEDEIKEFIQMVNNVTNDIDNLEKAMDNFYDNFGYERDKIVFDRLDATRELLNNFIVIIDKYSDNRNTLLTNSSYIIKIINNMKDHNLNDTELKYLQYILDQIDNMIRALSYIAGKNNKVDSDTAMKNINDKLQEWYQFINTEESVFTTIFDLTKEDNNYLKEIKKHIFDLSALIEYMDTVNIEYIPDNSRPTYNEVYEAEEIEIISGGFRHNKGEYVFIRNLGSYKITEVSGSICKCVSAEDTGYRKTTFRDPCCQNTAYDSITNGNGMGIMINPTKSKKTVIINDEIIDQVIMNIKNGLYLIEKNTESYNPFENTNFIADLEKISNIKESWQNILKVYGLYMSDGIRLYGGKLINQLTGLITACNHFIEVREKINPSEVIKEMNSFLLNVRKQYEYNGGDNDENFNYYTTILLQSLKKLSDFNGNGSTWSDGNKLSPLLSDLFNELNFYKENVIKNILIEDTKDLIDQTIVIEKMIHVVKDNIIILPNTLTAITPTIERIEKMISNKPKLHQDEWYQFKYAGVAEGGFGYQKGDIVEIIPELPTDKEGNQIHDMEEVIFNDVILLQITKVENGEVSELTPLMDYALPYKIWGIRKTKTRVGNGYGLMIDAYSYIISISDSTLLNQDNDPLPMPMFGENDLFVYKFENIHDLDIKYEVFLAGKQISNFIQRHYGSENNLHPNNIDAVYINANSVMDLKESHMDVTTKHRFINKLDKIEIKDPGAGYSLGQIIYVDAGNFMLKLRVTELDGTPYKGIKDIEMVDESMEYDTSADIENAEVISRDLNNIDDEFNVGYYDNLTYKTIKKPLIRSLGIDKFDMNVKRFDNLIHDDRNSKFLYPDIGNESNDPSKYGDSDERWFLGSRANDDRIFNGINNVVPPTDPFIKAKHRIPPNQPIKGNYQSIIRQRIHNSVGETNTNVNARFEGSVLNNMMVGGDLSVESYSLIPKHVRNFSGVKIGKICIVEHDETNDNHRMAYKVRTFTPSGYLIYDLPEYADYAWNSFDIDWMDIDHHSDFLTLKAQYPDAKWTEKYYHTIVNSILNKKVTPTSAPELVNNTTYIPNLTIDDISVFNWTTKKWEDLSDTSKWELVVTDDDKNKRWGFQLNYTENGIYSYDMELFLNKKSDNLKRLVPLRRNAIVSLKTSLVGETQSQSISTKVSTSRHLRIRKLFPYEQKETFTLGFTKDKTPLGYNMDFKLANYLHYKNELHLEDVKIYNRSTGKYEDIFDTSLFEVRFKKDHINQGYETQTKVVRSLIGNAGKNFYDGIVWGYNEEFDIVIFGRVKADYDKDGHLLSFELVHCAKLPEESISLEFNVFQNDSQTEAQMAVVVIEFVTEKVLLHDDGYIHNVTNRLAPLPKEFRIIVLYDLNKEFTYDVIIDKTPKKWTFIEPKWLMNPTFHIKDYNIPQDRVYILTDNGRFPLVNPSTGKPSLHVVETTNGTDVTFMNLYRRYEHMHVCTTPYPMRSVYTQRRIPSHGFISVKGKINKPLNKKYFEFWVNGRLLHDEVTIISPTKFVLHGLRSLKNLEIIEINRDSNEYFSDNYLEIKKKTYGRPFISWNFDTYLDAVLEGRLDGDNYTEKEQEYLLTPVWKQVNEDHPEFKNYPPNADIEDDILLRTNPDDYPINDLENPSYQFLVINQPTLEGKPIVEQTLTFRHFGFKPITNEMLIDMMNEIWGDEISNNPYFPEHTILSNDDWYGMATRLYNEHGELVHNLNDAAYHVTDRSLLRISAENKISRIIPNPTIYDLS